MTGRPSAVCCQGRCPHRAVRLGRCPEHAAEREAHQRRTTPTKMVEPRERARRKRAVELHVTRKGWWCPGWGRPSHQVKAGQLTADDVDPVAVTGKPSRTLMVMCRSCNSRKGARRVGQHRDRGGASPHRHGGE